MKFSAKLPAVLLCTAFALVACSSAPVKKTEDNAPAEAPAVAADEEDEFHGIAPGNLDTAHAAFIQALDLEMRGLQHEADSMWMLAWRYDPRSRYLSFRVAQKMLAVGRIPLRRLSRSRRTSCLASVPPASSRRWRMSF